MRAEDIAKVRVEDLRLLTGYYEEVVDKAIDYFDSLDEVRLGDIVDRRWDPPVTRAVRIVSIIDDAAQHAGQAAYLRGMKEALRGAEQ